MPRGSLAKRTKVEDTDAHESRLRYLAKQNPTSPKICHRMAGEQYPWLTLVIGSGGATSENQENALLEKARTLRDRKLPPGHAKSIEKWSIGAAVTEFVIDVICDRLRLDKEEVEGRGRPRKTVPSIGEPAGESVPDWLFYLFAAAALSTRLYYRIKSLTFEAPRRPDRTDDAILPEDAESLPELEVDFVAPCKGVLKILMRPEHVDEIVNGLAPEDVQDALDGADRENLEATVKAVLDQMAEGLTPTLKRPSVRIRLTELRALTEFAWFCFTKISRPSVYPGWSDLLLDLSNYDTVAKSVGTPLFPTIGGAQNLIRSRYDAANKESWHRIVSGTRGGEGHYLAAAKALNAQHQYRKVFFEREDTHGVLRRQLSISPGKKAANSFKEAANSAREEAADSSPKKVAANAPPATTAFVTSFDLELELSLLSLRQEFTVAMPIHILNKQRGVVYTCWVGLHVPAPDKSEDGDEDKDEDNDVRLRLLTDPDPWQWEILGSAAEKRGPIVVRLAGCPLVPLPSKVDPASRAFFSGVFGLIQEFLRIDVHANGPLGVEAEEKALEKLLDTLELQHAIVINEHDAVLQSAIDLISVPVRHGGQGRR